MRHLPLACLLLLVPVLALCPLRAYGEDEPDEAAADFGKAVAAWPAPSEDSAFRVELTAILGESPMGTMLIEGGPDVVEGKVVGWRLRERLALTFGDKEGVGTIVTRTARDLTPVAGESSENFSRAPESNRWQTADGTITITHKVGDGEPTTVTAKAAPHMMPGRAGMFMAARFLPARAATYRGTDFSGSNEKEPTAAFTLVVEPEEHYEGRKVMALRGTRGKKHVELFVERDSRDVVMARMWDDDSPMRLALLPQASAPAKDDLFAREPKNAAEGSAHALYAITVKDKALIEKMFRWSTMYEVTKQKLEQAQQPVPTFEEYRKATIESFAAGQLDPSTTPGQVKAGLQMYVSKVQIQDTPQGWKAVVWPKAFAHLLVVMEKKDDGWKAIGIRKLS